MRLIELRLRNIGLHERRDVRFSPGLVGIFGANGSGKTTLVNGIYAGLTGDFARFPGTKEEVITDTAAEDARAYIELVFEHAGMEYTLHRGLRPTRQSLTYARNGEQVTLRRDAEIKDFLNETLRLPKQILDQFVFVNQWEMFAFLSMTAAERMKAFHGLCDTSIAEKVWDLAGKMLLKDSAGDVVIDTGTLKELVVLYRTQRSNYHNLLDEVRELRAKLPDRATLVTLREAGRQSQQRVEIERKLHAAVENIAVLHENQLKLAQKAADAELAHKDNTAYLEEHNTQFGKDINTLPILRKYLKEVDSLEADELELAQAIQQRDSHIRLGKPTPPEDLIEPGDMQEAAKALSLQEASLQEAIKFLRHFRKTGKSTCPTCGSNVDKLIRKYRRVYKARDQVYQQQERLTNSSEYHVGLDLYEEILARRERDVQKCEAIVTKLKEAQSLPKGVKSTQDAKELVETINERVKEYEAVEKKAEASDEAREAALRVQASGAARLTALQEQITEYRVELDALPRVDRLQKRALRWKKVVAKLKAYRKAKASLQQAKRAAVSTLASYNTERERILALRKRGLRNKKWVALLNRVRDVFHRDAAAKLVAQSQLEGLVDPINEFLRPFGSPFVVSAGNDMDLLAQLPGHPARAATWLSGGQKVVLSLAFQLAQNLGLLVLDEPTAGLDADNQNYLKSALRRFQATARAQGLQIIVITHAEALAGVFNQVIRL